MRKGQAGILRDILEVPEKTMVNIVDLDQRILQGIVVMSMVADFGKATAAPKELEGSLQRLAADLGVEVSVLPLDQYRGRRRGGKNLQVVTILARDRVGIIYDVASLAAERGINIERAQVTARGELISIEFVMDFGALDVRREREELKAECEKLGLDVVIQDLDKSAKEKRLIVFDMDSTIVDFRDDKPDHPGNGGRPGGGGDHQEGDETSAETPSID